MGVSLDNQNAEKKYKEAIHKMTQNIIYRVIRPYVRDWMIPFMPNLHKETKQIEYALNSFTDKIIKERRNFHEQTNYKLLSNVYDEESSEEALNDPFFDKTKKLSMLDLLLDAEKKGGIDDEGIKEEVATFIFEGHDTTAMALCFSLILLAENKDAQNKARTEVEDIFAPKNGKYDTSDLQKMFYLERCIKETLRLYPSVPIITRYLEDDVQLKHCFIPKYTNVGMNLEATHKNPEFWPEPNKFDPDRFLPDLVRSRHPFAYVPFSAGPRNCIGQKFAMLELKSILANILYNFYLEPIDSTSDFELFQDVVIRANKDIKVKFVRKNKQK